VKNLSLFRENDLTVTDNVTAEHFPIARAWLAVFHGFSFLRLAFIGLAPLNGDISPLKEAALRVIQKEGRE